MANAFHPPIAALLVFLWVGVPAMSYGQDMLDHVDMNSAQMTQAEMTREELIAFLAAAGEVPVDLTSKRLSGLDLREVDFKAADMRWVMLNNADLRGARMQGVNLDFAWLMGANLEGADLSGAHLFSTQIRRANLRNARLDGARIVANFQQSDLRGASFRHADMAADMKNQSMGLMGTVLQSANADGADFANAKLGNVNAEFSSLRGARLENADLMNAKLGGADLTGAIVTGLNLANADLDSVRLQGLQGGGEVLGLDSARNLSKALTD